MEPKYLGDGVYFNFDKQTANVILTTGSHVEDEASNTIFLEPSVVINLVKALAEIPIPAKS